MYWIKINRPGQEPIILEQLTMDEYVEHMETLIPKYLANDMFATMETGTTTL